MNPFLHGFVEELEKSGHFGSDLVSGLGGLGGVIAGAGTGRNIAGDTAAEISPQGRKTRSESVARSLAWAGAPIGGLAALALAGGSRGRRLISKIMDSDTVSRITSDTPEVRDVLRGLLHGAVGFSGTAAGGAATGALVGGVQRLRGHPRQEAVDERRKTPKEAFLEGVASELEKSGIFGMSSKERREKAMQGFEAAVQSMDTVNPSYPFPSSVRRQWRKEFQGSDVKGVAEGWNFHAGKFNEWLHTPAGRKWNDAQAKVYRKNQALDKKVLGK